ncbi:hypothetical protein K493DRAFT_302293 [Basidiobolus meristosporus CBS 931.73]|uniref:Uncharacterized protein n=1 Tax=Basidiobolus meristosporus CBS 931.73 TaxID=1314790 RepID=A0A1Y1Y7Q2_9FUNG|nr:hypothetical protein K493DRAFT_302293 [Basidiobolus meristosporus CBS 931.73]|eukprot:ORX94050.1 hypothetical protein K493DRAFT_302293 [Basidiobolus meristosporus CBS 931.73]
MSFASYEDPEPGFQLKPLSAVHQLGSNQNPSYSVVTSPQSWIKGEKAAFTPEASDDDEVAIPKTPQEIETHQIELFQADSLSAKSEQSHSVVDAEIDEPSLEGYASATDSVSTSQSMRLRHSIRNNRTNHHGRFDNGTKLKLVQNKTEALASTSEHTDDGLSVLLNSANHLVQAFLVLFKTNQTAFLATASWHLIVGYSLAKSGATTLLTHAHLPFGSEQLNPTTLLLTKFMGKMNMPWTFLALMGFRMKDLSSQKILLLTFAFASLIQLRFHIKYLSNRQQWNHIFSRHNMGSVAVMLINLGCYISSVRRSGRLL